MVVLVLVAPCLFPLHAPAAEAAVRPNVLFIVADDLRNELGCYGVPAVKSPNIDRLAARGVRFDRAYVQYPVCNPSRSSFLTGLRPDTTRVLDNSVKVRKNLPDVVTLPQMFKENGYFTASLGKIFHRGGTMEERNEQMDDEKSWTVSRFYQATATGLRGEGRNMTGGKLNWCRWLAADGDDEDQPDGQVARDAIKLMEEQKDKPFFLAVGFHKPHDPFIAPKKYFDLYPLDSLKPHVEPADRTKDLKIATGGGALAEAFDKFTDAERREFMRCYYAGTTFTDTQVGKVLDALERLKLADKTIVVFVGDHGYHLGEHGWWNKNTIFEYSARAPLIMALPDGRSAGKSTPAVVEFLNLFPTLADLTGVKPPAGLQGVSMRPLLENPATSWDRPAYTQVQRGKSAGRSVRTDRWRYTEWDDGKAGVELYDHQTDAGEYRNVASDPKYAAEMAKLKGIVKP